MEPQNNIPSVNNQIPVPTIIATPEQSSLFGKIIVSCFRTKWLTLLIMIFVSVVLFSVGSLMSGLFSSLTPFGLWLVIAGLLYAFGFRNEAKNILGAFLWLFLLLLVLAVIGFGVCLLVFSH